MNDPAGTELGQRRHGTPAGRLLYLLASLRARVRDPRLRTYSLIGATAILTLGLYLSLHALPPDVGLVRPWLLVLSATVGVPLAVLLTVVETWVSARIVNVQFSWWLSLRVSVLASAANMLPLPGGPLVRVSVLTKSGAGLGASSAATGLVAIGWLGLAFLYAAVGARATSTAIAVGFVATGSALTIASAAGLYYLRRSWTIVSALLLIKCAVILVDLYRMKWALGALGVAAGIRDVSIFAVSGVAGAAVSFVPAGLGVNEAAAALLAPLSDISSSGAFLATGINRALALAIILPLALVVTATSKIIKT